MPDIIVTTYGNYSGNLDPVAARAAVEGDGFTFAADVRVDDAHVGVSIDQIPPAGGDGQPGDLMTVIFGIASDDEGPLGGGELIYQRNHKRQKKQRQRFRHLRAARVRKS